MEQTTGGQMGFEAAAETAIDGVAPPVRAQPCAAFRPDHAWAWPVCGACGWLEDDHAVVIATAAVVTELPRRRVPLPERKAS
jgi:hypothetical protein